MSYFRGPAGMVIVAITLALVVITGYGGLCSKSDKKNDSGNSAQQGTVVIVSGALDGTTVAGLPPHQNIFSKYFCSLFAPLNAYALGADVNRIIAISSRGNSYTVTEAILTGNNFSLSIPKDKPYLLVFLNNSNIIGTYKVDTATDLDALPLNEASSNIDVGIVALDSGAGVLTGTVATDTLFANIGITPSLASTIGIMDDEMLRLAGSLDVDQNGLLDTLEGKWYPFIIHYEMDPGVFTDTVNAFSQKSPIAYNGYGFYLHMNPYDTTLDWNTGGTLTPPASINGVTTNASGPAWVSGNQASLDFFSGGGPGTNPPTPPSGTYTVTMPGTGSNPSKNFVYANVKSIASGIDVNLYNIYIPTIKFNIDGTNRITTIEVVWWKKLADNSWVQPDTTELNMLLHDSTMEISPYPPSGPSDPRISVGVTSFSNPMTLTPPAQDFTAGYVRMIYTDKFGYVYGFSWNN